MKWHKALVETSKARKEFLRKIHRRRDGCHTRQWWKAQMYMINRRVQRIMNQE